MNKFFYIFLLSNFFILINAQDQEVSFSNGEKYIQKKDDIRKKSSEIKQMIKNAVKHFAEVSLEDACNDFIHNPAWRKGEIFVFVFDSNGNCLAHGDDVDIIWNNFSKVKVFVDRSLIQEMLKYKNGGTLGYMWNHAYKVSYIQVVTKNNQQYILGAGFYPENERFKVQQLVHSAADFFRRNGPEDTFAILNNSRGPFRSGSIIVFAYDLNGICVADGNNPVFIGQNMIDVKDENGNPFVQMIIEKAKKNNRGWIEYNWKREFQRVYVQKVVDPKTQKEYAFAAGYFPYVSLKVVQTFLNKAVQHLKSNGPKIAFADFSNTVGDFVRGPMAIDAFTFDGQVLADGNHPELVGHNVLKLQDPTGRYIIKNIINVAQKYGKGIVSYIHENANTIAFVQVVDIPDGKFILSTKYYPNEKSQSAKSMAKQAIDHLKVNPNAESFNAFSKRNGIFYRGDLYISVYDSKGTRLVNGINKTQTWNNLLKTTDQEGKPVIEDVIDTALNGGGWFEYVTRNAKRRIYVESLEKENRAGQVETFIVGCGYFI